VEILAEDPNLPVQDPKPQTLSYLSSTLSDHKIYYANKAQVDSFLAKIFNGQAPKTLLIQNQNGECRNAPI